MGLLEKKEYFARFHYYVSKDMTHLEAFRKLQDDVEKEYGRIDIKPHKDYHAFKMALHRYFKGE